MKGQMVSIDTISAVTLFVILISLVIFFSNTIDYRASTIEDLRNARDGLIDISDKLIVTPGDPVFWHTNGTSIKSFGLAYADHKLSSDKIYTFNRTSANDYNNFRSLMDVGRFDVYTELLTIDEGSNCTVTSGSAVFNLTAGKYPNGENVISITRIVKMDDDRFCKFRIWVWK